MQAQLSLQRPPHIQPPDDSPHRPTSPATTMTHPAPPTSTPDPRAPATARHPPRGWRCPPLRQVPARRRRRHAPDPAGASGRPTSAPATEIGAGRTLAAHSATAAG
ncbi:MAG: hypothetical protein WDW36_000705 [Sanguina aurantia]